MILLDKLSQRPAKPQQSVQTQAKPMGAPTAKPTVTPSVSQRLSSLPQRGAMGSMPEWSHEPRRFVSDLPAKVQLEGIQNIINGQDTQNDVVNNFVKGMASQGKTPEEIRLAFIEQEKKSPSPLVLL